MNFVGMNTEHSNPKKTKSRGAAKKVSTSRKNIGGAPIKLTNSLLENLCKLIDQWNPTAQETPYDKISDFQRLSTADCVAHNIGISKPTLYSYTDNKDGIYDTKLSNEFFNAINRWQTKRNYLHQVLMPDWVAFHTT